MALVSRALVASLIPASSVPAPSGHNPHAPPPPKAEGPVAHLIVAAELAQSASVTTAASLSGKINLQREAQPATRSSDCCQPASRMQEKFPRSSSVRTTIHLELQEWNERRWFRVTAVHPDAGDEWLGHGSAVLRRRDCSQRPIAASMSAAAAFTGEDGPGRQQSLRRSASAGLSRSRIRSHDQLSMVGRLGGSPEPPVPTLSVQGGDSATEWKDFILPACPAERLVLQSSAAAATAQAT